MICLVFKLSKNILAYFQNYFPTSQFPQLIHPPGARHPAWGQERRYWSDPSVQTTPPLRPPPAPGGVGVASPTGLGIPGLHGVGGRHCGPYFGWHPPCPHPAHLAGQLCLFRGCSMEGIQTLPRERLLSLSPKTPYRGAHHDLYGSAFLFILISTPQTQKQRDRAL